MTTRQLIILICIALLTLATACFDDGGDEMDVPRCGCTPSTPKPPTCDSKKKWLCVCDPHCRQNKNPFNWDWLSECELQEMQKRRDNANLAGYIFLRTIGKERCAALNQKGGLFGCCQRNVCPNKCGCPTKIRNYPCCCGSIN